MILRVLFLTAIHYFGLVYEMSALKRKCSAYLWLINDSPTKRRVLHQSHVTNESLMRSINVF